MPRRVCRAAKGLQLCQRQARGVVDQTAIEGEHAGAQVGGPVTDHAAARGDGKTERGEAVKGAAVVKAQGDSVGRAQPAPQKPVPPLQEPREQVVIRGVFAARDIEEFRAAARRRCQRADGITFKGRRVQQDHPPDRPDRRMRQGAQREETPHGMGDEMNRAVRFEALQGGDQPGKGAAGAHGGLQRLFQAAAGGPAKGDTDPLAVKAEMAGPAQRLSVGRVLK